MKIKDLVKDAPAVWQSPVTALSRRHPPCPPPVQLGRCGVEVPGGGAGLGLGGLQGGPGPGQDQVLGDGHLAQEPLPLHAAAALHHGGHAGVPLCPGAGPHAAERGVRAGRGHRGRLRHSGGGVRECVQTVRAGLRGGHEEAVRGAV